MKKFSRCALILILVLILGSVGGYIYGNKVVKPTYTSVAQLYIVPGTEMEASLRNKDGGLNDDFGEVITNSVVISDAKSQAGTSENISKYIQVQSQNNSNIINIICTNPDAGTAKTYVDAVAKSAVKNIKKVIPVEDVSILSTGTVQSEPGKPELIYYIIGIGLLSAAACLLIEIIVLLCMSAFKKTTDNSDDELEYERNYGKYAVISRDDVKVLKDAMTEVAASKAGTEGSLKNVKNEEQEVKESHEVADTVEEESFAQEEAGEDVQEVSDDDTDTEVQEEEAEANDEAEAPEESETESEDDEDEDEDDGVEDDDQEPEEEKGIELSSKRHVTIIGRIKK